MSANTTQTNPNPTPYRSMRIAHAIIKSILGTLLLTTFCSTGYSAVNTERLIQNELASLKWKTFNSFGSQKANGLVITFDYPLDWNVSETNDPRLLNQVMIREDMNSRICTLTLTKMDTTGTEPSEETIGSIFTPTELPNYAPPGSTILGAIKTTLDGKQAGWVKFSIDTIMLGLPTTVVGFNEVTYLKRSLIYFQCSVVNIGESRKHAQQSFDDWAPVFNRVLRSLKIRTRN